MTVDLYPPPLHPEQVQKVRENLEKIKGMGPIGHRIGEACESSMRAFYGQPLREDEKEAHVQGLHRPGEVAVAARVMWLENESKLILAFQGLTSEWDTIQKDCHCVHLGWFNQSLCRKVRVHHYFAAAFESLLLPEKGSLNLSEALDEVLGGQRPVRVLCCGYGLGGAVAQIASVWGVMHYPAADLRCITFQSPRVGNAAFVKLFHWLVGTNYRIVHRDRGKLFTGIQPLDPGPNNGSTTNATSATTGTFDSSEQDIAQDLANAQMTVNMLKGGTDAAVKAGKRVYMCIIESAGTISDLPYYGQVTMEMLDPEVSFQETRTANGEIRTTNEETRTTNGETRTTNGAGRSAETDALAPALPREDTVEQSRLDMVDQEEGASGVDERDVPLVNHDKEHTEASRQLPRGPLQGLPSAVHHGAENLGHAPGDIVREVKGQVRGVTQHLHDKQKANVPKVLRFAPQSGTFGVDGLWQEHTSVTVQQRREDARPEDSFKRTYTVEKVRVGTTSPSLSTSLRVALTSIPSRLASFGSDTMDAGQKLLSGRSRKASKLKRSKTEGDDVSDRSPVSPNAREGDDVSDRSPASPNARDTDHVRRVNSVPVSPSTAPLDITDKDVGDNTDNELQAENHPRDAPGNAMSQTPVHHPTQNRGCMGIRLGKRKTCRHRPCCRAEARQIEVCSAALKHVDSSKSSASDSSGAITPSGSGGSSNGLASVFGNRMWPSDVFQRDSPARSTSNATTGADGAEDHSGMDEGMGVDEGLQADDNTLKSLHSSSTSGYQTLIEQELSGSLNQVDKISELLLSSKVRQALLLSRAAYYDQEAFRARTGMTNAQLVQDKIYDTQVYVGWLDPGIAVLAFRGTANARDATQDLKALRGQLDFLPGKFAGCRVHVGFMQQFNAVIDADNPDSNIAEALDRVSGGRQPFRILCCGHSLGGALATLAAAWCALHYQSADIRCITFGSPRVGNNKFRSAFHALVGSSIRVVNGSDPVPTLPPPWKFTHVNNPLYFQAGSLTPVQLSVKQGGLQLNVLDHYLNAYAYVLYSAIPHHLLTHQERTEFGDIIESVSTLHSSEGGANKCGCIPGPTILIRSLSRANSTANTDS